MYGTIPEIAKILNVKINTVYFYSSKAHKRRNKMRKGDDNNCIVVERIEKEVD